MISWLTLKRPIDVSVVEKLEPGYKKLLAAARDFGVRAMP